MNFEFSKEMRVNSTYSRISKSQVRIDTHRSVLRSIFGHVTVVIHTIEDITQEYDIRRVGDSQESVHYLCFHGGRFLDLEPF